LKQNTNGKKKKKGTTRYVVLVSLGTFFSACFLAIASQYLLKNFSFVLLSLLLLLLIIFIGIIFDIIGVAVTVADEAPFHARAARRTPGAQQAITLVREAHKVANICNDVVGDICGTVSGSLGAAIIFIIFLEGDPKKIIFSVLMTGLVSAITVGGKALGKTFAINKANEIVWQVAQILAWRELLNIKKSK